MPQRGALKRKQCSDNNGRQKRQRRGRPARDLPIPDEIFRLLVDQLCARASFPSSTLLKLSMVCRSARTAVLGNVEAWFESLRRSEVNHFQTFSNATAGPPVVRDIPMSPYPNFKAVEGFRGQRSALPPFLWRIKRLQWPDLGGGRSAPFTEEEKSSLAEHAIRRARLYHGQRCGCCGARRTHHPVWGLGCRVCSSCLKQNLISSASLFFEYGFEFHKHLSEILGRVFYFTYSSSSRFVLYNLSHNPVDFRKGTRENLVFSWKPHLERVVDLGASKARRAERAAAACRLAAAVRGLYARVVLGQGGRFFTRATSHRFYVHAPAKPRKRGGFYSARPCTEEERAIITRNDPDQRLEAKALLRESFLAFRGRLTLPCTRNPRGALDRLRMLEAVREESLIKPRVPSVRTCRSHEGFLAGRDMPVDAPLFGPRAQ